MAALRRWIGGAQATGTTATSLPSEGKPQPISAADYKQFGLENFGNTCYANSVLQALYFCHPFRELVLAAQDVAALPSATSAPSGSPAARATIAPQPNSPPAKASAAPSAFPRDKLKRRDSQSDTKASTSENAEASSSKGPLIPDAPPSLFSALWSLFNHIALNTEDKGSVSPTAFIAKLRKENEIFRTPQHQDAHEFLNFLLNKVVEDIEQHTKERRNSIPQDNASASSSSGVSKGSSSSTFIHNLFEGTLTSETRCLTCETLSARDESFLDLSIDIEQNSSVTACLRQFSASEMLTSRNKFFCDSCCGLQEAEKRMKIKKLPNVLALHLKRFKYQEDQQKYIKLAYRVPFPLELRLFNTVDDAENPDRRYDLFAIVVHIGSGPHHGHYVTIVRSRDSWVIIDDDTVDAIKESDIAKYFGDTNSGVGYVLFYQAENLEQEGIPIKPSSAASAPEAAADTDNPAPAEVPLLAEAEVKAEPIEQPNEAWQMVDSPKPFPMTEPQVSEPPLTPASSNHGFLRSLRQSNPSKAARQSAIIPPTPTPPPPLPPSPQKSITPATPNGDTAHATSSRTTSSSRHSATKDHQKEKSSSKDREREHLKERDSVISWLVPRKSKSKRDSRAHTRSATESAVDSKKSVHLRPATSDGRSASTSRDVDPNLTASSSSSRISMIPVPPLDPAYQSQAVPPTSPSSKSDTQRRSRSRSPVKGLFDPSEVPPPSPRSPTDANGARRKSARPSTAPSSNPPSSAFRASTPPPPIPPLPPTALPTSPNPEGDAQLHGTTGLGRRKSVGHSLASSPPSASSAEKAHKPRRKLSFNAVPSLFGHKHKDKDKSERSQGSPPPVIPARAR